MKWQARRLLARQSPGKLSVKWKNIFTDWKEGMHAYMRTFQTAFFCV